MMSFLYNPVYPFLLLLALVSGKSQQTGTVKKIQSAYLIKMKEPVWDDPVWDDPETVKMDGDKAASDNQLRVFSRWNNDSLSFCFRVADTDLRAFQNVKDHPKLYLDDMVEILLDTRNDKDSCWSADDLVYHVNLNGIKKDDRGSVECITNPLWDGYARISVKLFGTLHDTTDIDKGYLMMLNFPWKELAQEPHRGLLLGINFANGDNDGKGRQLYDWAGASPMRSPCAFGNVVLN